MLNPSENLVIIRIPHWKMNSSEQMVSYKVQFPIEQWVVSIHGRVLWQERGRVFHHKTLRPIQSWGKL